MERLWAPWRMAYIDKPQPNVKPPGCIFCDKPAQGDDSANWIVHRGVTGFVILNAYPYNNGHIMVVPYRHLSRLADLSHEENSEMLGLAALLTRVLDDVMRPDGYNVGMNLGQVAGAGIADHLHLHVVPRWNGDTNFMPVLADVKVMPETLDQVYEKIAGRLRAEI